MADDTKNGYLEILGQKLYFPNSAFTLAGFIVFIVAVVYLFCFMMVKHYGISKNKDGISFTHIGEDKTDVTSGHNIGFWTPGDSTKSYVAAMPEKDKVKYKWQISPATGKNFEEANRAFGKSLKNRFGFLGYRRYKVHGEGESNYYKEGWWWSVGFAGKCDNDFLKSLKDFYVEFWNPDAKDEKWEKLYVEIDGNIEK